MFIMSNPLKKYILKYASGFSTNLRSLVAYYMRTTFADFFQYLAARKLFLNSKTYLLKIKEFVFYYGVIYITIYTLIYNFYLIIEMR